MERRPGRAPRREFIKVVALTTIAFGADKATNSTNSSISPIDGVGAYMGYKVSEQFPPPRVGMFEDPNEIIRRIFMMRAMAALMGFYTVNLQRRSLQNKE